MGHWINKRDQSNRRKNRVLHNESLEPRQLLAGHGWGAAHAEGSSGTDGMPGDRDCPAAQVASQDGEQTRLLGRSSQRGRGAGVHPIRLSDPALRPSVCQQQLDDAEDQSTNANPADETLDPLETADLLHMREEEKLARDVYQKLGDLYGEAIFANIAASEQRHMDAMKTLLDRYGLEDPVGENPAGVFLSAELQAMYDSLIARGEKSLADAYQVGVDIEELDIGDLEEAITATDNLDIQRVYGSLLAGSQNHLSAFTAALNGNLTSAVGDSPGGANRGQGSHGQNAGRGQQLRQQQTQVRDQVRDQVFAAIATQERTQAQQQGSVQTSLALQQLIRARARSRR